MSALINEDHRLRDLSGVFKDLTDAGEALARSLEIYRGMNAIVLAIPSGGVPIGLSVSSHLALPFDMLIIRKLPIPGNPEAGFGAISLEGDMILNDHVVRMLGLSEGEIEEQAESVLEELRARDRIFRENRPRTDLKGKIVILTDDGLASGYTMMTAACMVRKQQPMEIVVAVPTASLHTIALMAKEVDNIICLNVRTGSNFSVAEAYRDWYDLSKEEVVNMLKTHRFLMLRQLSNVE
jgi:predicted phosphoribosyltransferase